MRNGKEKVKDFAVTQYHRTTKDGIKLEGYSIRTEQYRYTEWIKGLFKDNDGKYESNNVYDRELFDYYSFPDETENLINKDKYQNVIENIKKLIKEYFVKQNRFKN